MNLLVVSPWFPYPPDNGSRLRAFHLIRELAAHHRIRLVAGVQDDIRDRIGGAIPEPLRACCAAGVTAVPWRWYAPDPAKAWRALFTVTPRSILETDNTAFAHAVAAALKEPTDVALALELGSAPLMPPISPPVVLDQIEVSGIGRAYRTARGKAKMRHCLTMVKAHAYWRRALRRFRAITAVSEEEAAAVRGMLGTGGDAPPVVVVPNGVDVHNYRRIPGKVVPGRLLYNGALSYAPNLDAVRWFAREVLPLVVAQVPNAHLTVTGRNEGLEIEDLRADPRIHLTGFLPDLRPALDEATVCVVPLRAGGGTRLKILEAFAAELPVVSTTIGAAGLAARDGHHLLLADSAEAFAAAVVRLLREPGTADGLAQAARSLAEKRYDWPAIAADLSDLLERTAAGRAMIQ